MDNAFTAIEDKSNPWHNISFNNLCLFFDDWFYLVPVNNSPTFDELVYIKNLSWF
jgi:hypothetical protein